MVLENTQDQNSQRSQSVLHPEEVHIALINEKTYEGIDFVGTSFNLEDREVGIKNGEQDDQKKGGEEPMPVAVNTQMGFPICLPSDAFTPS